MNRILEKLLPGLSQSLVAMACVVVLAAIMALLMAWSLDGPAAPFGVEVDVPADEG
jgi:hypothetical protein